MDTILYARVVLQNFMCVLPNAAHDGCSACTILSWDLLELKLFYMYDNVVVVRQ